MAVSDGDRLTKKDGRYIQGLRSVAKFSWLMYIFAVLLLVQLGATVYFFRAILYDREIVVWQSISQCLALLFIIILFREKLVAHRVIEKLIRKSARRTNQDEG